MKCLDPFFKTFSNTGVGEIVEISCADILTGVGAVAVAAAEVVGEVAACL